MADAVTSQTLQDGDKSVVMKFTNISDGSGEAAVKKVDVSALQAQSGSGAACTGVSIQCVWYECNGMSVDLLWDASTDVIACICFCLYSDRCNCLYLFLLVF